MNKLKHVCFVTICISIFVLSLQARAQDIQLVDTIEALCLGTGELAPTDGIQVCPFNGFWSSFPRGTTVRVIISTTVSEDKREAIISALGQVPGATRGEIQVTFEITDDPNPIPGMNEVTSTTHPDPVSQGCFFDVGCTIHEFIEPGVLFSSRAVQPPDQTVNAYVHDVVGHGVLGLCHIDGDLIGGAQNSLMSGGPGVFSGDTADELTMLDIDVLHTVYDSMAEPGDTDVDFIDAVLEFLAGPVLPDPPSDEPPIDDPSPPQEPSPPSTDNQNVGAGCSLSADGTVVTNVPIVLITALVTMGLRIARRKLWKKQEKGDT